ncbi:MAG: hypothetical protein N7Q72_05620 [Spiroplasma sp. Tabriz.8]|nr:hypothetical protein [Candidatus Regiella insecticola]MCZ8632724.1 hypothetical protein [Spiroplasma sp. Tabriz.8]
MRLSWVLNYIIIIIIIIIISIICIHTAIFLSKQHLSLYYFIKQKSRKSI